jgi:hypothetical protein
MSRNVLAALLAGTGVGIGIALLVAARRPASTRPLLVQRWTALSPALGCARRRLVAAAGCGFLVAIATRWTVAAVGTLVLVAAWPTLVGATRVNRLAIARLDALATWTESLRDTVSAAAGLEQAIVVSVPAAPPLIQPHVARLAARLGVGERLPSGLRALAADVDDPSADLVIAALLSSADVRGPGLVALLTGLAEQARNELDMRRRIEAARRGTLRGVRIVVSVSLLMAVGLVLFAGSYLDPYDSARGQVVLALIIAIFAIALIRIGRLARIELPGRFLEAPGTGQVSQ